MDKKFSKLKLVCSDGEVFEVGKEVISISSLFRGMVENCDVSDDDEAVPLQLITGSIFRKIVTWAQFHKDDKEELTFDEQREKRSDDISAWDSDFLKVDQGTLFELLLAANFLGIDCLLDAACKTVANQIRGKLPDEIRKTFNIQNDFTPEEEEEVRNENAWCETK